MKVKNFHEDIEKSLEKLGKHVEKETASYEAETLPEKEVVKRSIQALSRDLPQDREEEKRKEPEGGDSVLPNYLQGEGGEEIAKKEVEDLIDLVFKKGLEAALKKARKESPFIEDAFHDALVDKLLPELKRKGIIK